MCALKMFSQKMERVMGIEPTWPAWKAGALPLSYTRIHGDRKIIKIVVK